LFHGCILPSLPPIYIGVYVDDLIYFSESSEIESIFEENFSASLDGKVEFFGQVTQFLGCEFTWEYSDGNNLSVTITQESFITSLLDSLDLHHASVRSINSPYRSGLVIDSVPSASLTSEDHINLKQKYQSLVGSLNWIAHTTRPDLSTVVSLLAQHQSHPSLGHYDSALHAAKYLANTKDLGIRFTSSHRSTLESFLHFPLPNTVVSMADANWGPQDASTRQPSTSSQSTSELPLFVSRSVSGFYIDLFGPLHWMSKRQTVTATSSAESEVYATNECVKFLLELTQLLDFLQIRDIFMPTSTILYNDNRACVDWSKNTTTKGLRHIQMRENQVRENVENGFIRVEHIDGKLNLADLFTKEHKDVSHFCLLRDLILCPRPRSNS